MFLLPRVGHLSPKAVPLARQRMRVNLSRTRAAQPNRRRRRARLLTSARWIPKFTKIIPARVPNAAWHWKPDVPLAPATRIEYTCPMHPEIVRPGPGSCPICGMALEPRTALVEEEENPELVSMTRRFWVSRRAHHSGACAGNVRYVARANRCESILSMRAMGWIELALATPVVLWCGWPFFERGWASIVNRSLNMFTLIAIGTGTAYIYSVIAVLFPGNFSAIHSAAWGAVPGVFRSSRVRSRRWCCSAKCSSLRARGRTSAAIRSLLKLSPRTARLVRADGTEIDVPVEHIAAGRHAARASWRKSSGGWSRDRRTRAQWTNRWSPASRFPWKKTPEAA